MTKGNDDMRNITDSFNKLSKRVSRAVALRVPHSLLGLQANNSMNKQGRQVNRDGVRLSSR